jgi:hypothetical protein|tara:strand:+ start:167 stop:538 length:372 start_codon:yes stop_codon:yes gene_type:complete
MNLTVVTEDKKKQWWEWHKKNRQVWELFQRFTFEAINSGKKNYSHWAIIQRIRWETDIVTKGDSFKISNDWIAYYARYFHHKYPEHKGFFKTKPLKHERGNHAVIQEKEEENRLKAEQRYNNS